jgi:large subunit ribosomal protein L33
MAKAARDQIGLECNECGHFNYLTERNKRNIEGKLKVKKYCRYCRKHTLHKEKAKLK